MERSNRIAQVCTLVILFVVLFVSASGVFAQVRKMSVKELTEESTAILVGKCTQKVSSWNDNHDKIFTRIMIQAEEYVKGNLGSEAEITIPGGRVDDILYEVSDMPIFNEGEETVVFVWTHPSGKHLITGAHQGKLRIVKDKKLGKRIMQGGSAQTESVTSLGKRISEPAPERKKVLLEDFLNEIKSYVKE